MLLAASAAAEASDRRPKNWRRAKKRVAAEARQDSRGPFIGSGWSPEARRALWELIAVRGSSATAYNAEIPPVAVVDRAAAADGDAAEIVFHRLVTEAEFRFGDEFWLLIPAGWGRQRLRAAYEQFADLPKSVWPSQPAYRQYRKGFLQSYLRICRHVGRKECRSYLARLLQGFTEEEAREYAKKALEEEAKQKPRDELIAESDQDPMPLLWPRGFHAAAPVGDLVAALRGAGFDVWTLGLTAQPVLAHESGLWGVDPGRVLGIKQSTERERLSGQLREPIPIRVGAVDAVISAVGRRPALVLVSSADLADLALYGDGLRVIVDRGDKTLRARLAGGAVVQPAFPRPKK